MFSLSLGSPNLSGETDLITPPPREVGHLRDEFPILSTKTYLASHSLGAVPRRTRESMAEYVDQWETQGIEAWDGPWWDAILDFGRTLEQILGADEGTVVPMTNATRGMAAIASCFTFEGKRRKIVLSDLEFTTVYPFWRGLEELGATLEIVPSEDGLGVSTERLAEAIDESTRLVVSSHAYFRSGALQDLKQLTQIAHAAGAHLIGDGYQAAGTVPVDVRQLQIDFYVGGCHKWLCGGAGAGYLYVRPDLIETLRPRLSGWFGLASPFDYDRETGRGTPHPGIFRFLGGTPAVPALYAAREGTRIVAETGNAAIREISKHLTNRIVEEARARSFTLRSPLDPEARNGMVCVDIEGGQEIVTELSAQDIIVDWRPDCGIRISPHFYNDFSDIDRLFHALDTLLKK